MRHDATRAPAGQRAVGTAELLERPMARMCVDVHGRAASLGFSTWADCHHDCKGHGHASST
eukprot:9784174-Lingulodinium_polyedra.AAC.1